MKEERNKERKREGRERNKEKKEDKFITDIIASGYFMHFNCEAKG
jgi:hypothetical protein